MCIRDRPSTLFSLANQPVEYVYKNINESIYLSSSWGNCGFEESGMKPESTVEWQNLIFSQTKEAGIQVLA